MHQYSEKQHVKTLRISTREHVSLFVLTHLSSGRDISGLELESQTHSGILSRNFIEILIFLVYLRLLQAGNGLS